MRAWLRGFGIAAAAALSVGCSVNSNFVYKPEAPAAGAPKAAARVAVLPFTDGTEDFRERGSVFSGGQYNLAKAGITGTITAITPDLWAKSFADDLAAAGAFPSAKFVFSRSELADEEYLVEGTVKKAYWGKRFEDDNELDLLVSAARRADNKVVWEREVSKTWKTPRTLYSGCGMGIQCMVDRIHGELNRALRAMFAEARADMTATIASLPGAGTVAQSARPGLSGAAAAADPPAAPAQESADQAIERILKGQ